MSLPLYGFQSGLGRKRCVRWGGLFVGVGLALWAGAIAADGPSSATIPDHAAQFERLMSRGQLSAAQVYFDQALRQSPDDSQARLGLGLTQFLQALEFLGQANHRFGILDNPLVRRLPLARLPVPENREADLVTYEDLRSAIAEFSQRLALSEQTLAQVNTVQVQPFLVYPGRIQLDLDGNGALVEEETFWRILAIANPQVTQPEGESFAIGFDGADVHWLRGYEHFLMAFCQTVLAYDERQLFERCGHLLFPRIRSPYDVSREPPRDPEGFDFRQIADAVAAIHLFQFPLEDPKKLTSAHEHLLTMIRESRQCWERAQAETDDHHEWIPNAKQKSVMGIAMQPEWITGWSDVLDELESLLEGRKLVPYWREYTGDLLGFGPAREIPERGRGINLKKFFLEPRDFDLILAVQGTGVEPYLEEGALSTPQTWNRLTDVFQGQFFGFAVWFN